MTVLKAGEVVPGSHGRRWLVQGGLGRGTCCDVMRVQLLASGTLGALKVYKAGDMYAGARDRELLLLDLVRKARPDNSQHLVAVLDQFYMRDLPCIVLELLESDVRQILHRHTPSPGLPLYTLHTLTTQLLRGLSILHGCGFVHGDLKPLNIMWCVQSGHLKLIDFSLSFHNKDKDVGPFQSPRHRCPEVELYNYTLSNPVFRELLSESINLKSHVQLPSFVKQTSFHPLAAGTVNCSDSPKCKSRRVCYLTEGGNISPGVHSFAAVTTGTPPSTHEQHQINHLAHENDHVKCYFDGHIAKRVSEADRCRECVCPSRSRDFGTLIPSADCLSSDIASVHHAPSVLQSNQDPTLENHVSNSTSEIPKDVNQICQKPANDDYQSSQYDLLNLAQIHQPQFPGDCNNVTTDCSIKHPEDPAILPVEDSTDEMWRYLTETSDIPVLAKLRLVHVQYCDICSSPGGAVRRVPGAVSDLWSVGCVLLELYTGHSVFTAPCLRRLQGHLSTQSPGMCSDTLVEGVVDEAFRSRQNKSENLADSEKSAWKLLKDLIRKLLKVCPEDRLTSTAAFAHPFIQLSPVPSGIDLLLLPSRVLRLSNVVEKAELEDIALFKDVKDDILSECRKHGSIAACIIPQEGVAAGKAYVEYSCGWDAVAAFSALCHKTYGSRPLLVHYHPLNSWEQHDYI